MKTVFFKNPFECLPKGKVLTLFIVLFFIVSGCKNQNNENVSSSTWSVNLKIKPQVDENYLATEDPKILALIAKQKVKLYQSHPEFNPSAFLSYYTLSGNSDKERTIKNFLATGIFEDNVYCINFACGVRLKLKPQTEENYLATEDPVILTLISKHDVAFRQDCPGAKNPELLLLYSITNEYYREINMADVIKDFLTTGKFEDNFIAYEDVHPVL